MSRYVVAFLAALTLHLGLPTSVRAITWVNETDLAVEADFGNLQHPSAINVQASQLTPPIYGQLYEAGLTEVMGPQASVFADVGYGPSGSDPRTNPNWTWFAANYNIQTSNNDEYSLAITAPATPGTYSYTYRYSLDFGATYTAGDIDGAGTNAGLAFSAANLGVMTVTAGPPPNEIDFGNLQFPASLNLQAGAFTGSIYGRAYEAGVTETQGDSGVITASLGYGPSGTDPRTSQQWTWTVASYANQIGNDDEYQVGFTAPAVNGAYSYTYRYSLNGGTSWLVADLNGNGTNGGLSFDLAQLGVLTVTGGTNPAFNPADFDKDHDVDKDDLAKWRSAWGGATSADSDGDGDADGADFLRWQRELGATGAEAASAAVPEPVSTTLVALALIASATQRRRRES